MDDDLLDCLSPAALQAKARRRVHKVLRLAVTMVFNKQDAVLDEEPEISLASQKSDLKHAVPSCYDGQNHPLVLLLLAPNSSVQLSLLSSVLRGR